MDKDYISLLARVNSDPVGYKLLVGLSRYSHGIVAYEGLIPRSPVTSQSHFVSQLEVNLIEMGGIVGKINQQFGNGVLLPTDKAELKDFAAEFIGGEFDQRR